MFYQQVLGDDMALTVDAGFDCFLNRGLKYLTLPPYLYDSSQLLLDFVRGPFVGGGRSFGNDGGESDQEVVFLPSL